MVEEETKTPASDHPPRRVVGKPFRPGQSGNPNGRPKIEPRVRRFARRYDRRMCKALADLALDPKVPPAERRRAAMDLISVGSGRPALVQEIAGRDGQPLGPLVALNFAPLAGQALAPEQAYQLMVSGAIEADGKHPAFAPRPPIEAESVDAGSRTEEQSP